MPFFGSTSGSSRMRIGNSILERGSFLIAFGDLFSALIGFITWTAHVAKDSRNEHQNYLAVASIIIELAVILMSIFLLHGVYSLSAKTVNTWFWVNVVVIGICSLASVVCAFKADDDSLYICAFIAYRSMECWIIKEFYWEITNRDTEPSFSYNAFKPEHTPVPNGIPSTGNTTVTAILIPAESQSAPIDS